MSRYLVAIVDDVEIPIELDIAFGDVPAGGLTEKLMTESEAVFLRFNQIIGKMGKVFNDAVSQMDQLPSEAQLQFGLKLDGEVGFGVAKSGVEAQYTITLTWKPTDEQS
jgi:hypothetical protein